MWKNVIGSAIVAIAAGFHPHGLHAQDSQCAVTPLTESELAAGPGALNDRLACLEKRLQRLEEQQSAAPSAAAGPRGARNASIAQSVPFKDVVLSLDYASVVQGTQAVLELSIENRSPHQRFALVDTYTNTQVLLRGEAVPRPFQILGFATCPLFGTARDKTKTCAERTTEGQWALLDPGSVQTFRIVTQSSRDDIKSDTFSVTLRLIVKDDHGWAYKDVPFSEIPLVR